MIKVKKFKMPQYLHKMLIFSRYFLWFLVIVFSSDFFFDLMNYDPQVNFLNFLRGETLSYAAYGVIVFYFFLAVFFERPFCNYFCLQGAEYGLLSSLRIFRIRRDPKLCINCGRCEQACPMQIKVSRRDYVSSLQCINCFECIESCPIKGTLAFKRIGWQDLKKIKIKLKHVFFFILPIGIAFYFMVQTNFLGQRTKDIDPSTYDTEYLATLPIKAAMGLEDGIYQGEARGYKDLITVAVTVADEKIAKVEVVAHSDDYRWFQRANAVIPPSIIEAQNFEVDVVTGATYTSQGIIEAARAALNGPAVESIDVLEKDETIKSEEPLAGNHRNRGKK